MAKTSKDSRRFDVINTLSGNLPDHANGKMVNDFWCEYFGSENRSVSTEEFTESLLLNANPDKRTLFGKNDLERQVQKKIQIKSRYGVFGQSLFFFFFFVSLHLVVFFFLCTAFVRVCVCVCTPPFPFVFSFRGRALSRIVIF